MPVTNLDRFRTACFVIMPFGKKTVGTTEIDFDQIFTEIFEPAINAVRLPDKEGGGTLVAVRTDRQFHTAVITQEMFEHIEYSRFALGDITGLNANVFYELGARHRAREAGTAIFRQADAPIPFDIAQIKAFPYSYNPEGKKAESRALITQVLVESLDRNAWDSPIWLALKHQHNQSEELQEVLRKAGEVLREISRVANEERGTTRETKTQGLHRDAEALYQRAIMLDPANPLHHVKVSYHYKAQGDWDQVIGHLQQALGKVAAMMHSTSAASAPYAEVHRELGIAFNKRDRGLVPNAGELELRRAVKLNADDYDAFASLGGVLKRAADAAQAAGDTSSAARLRKDALAAYERAVEVSRGHPYPLLNAIKLRAHLEGKLNLDTNRVRDLGRAEGYRRAQVSNFPPIDEPWSFFDLAEIQMYLGDAEASSTLEKGLNRATALWMPQTLLDSLSLLPAGSIDGLEQLTTLARKRVEALSG